MPTTTVERVLRRFARKHGPTITPPVLFARPHIKMRRKSPTPAVDTLRLMHVFRLKFSAVVIDHHEVEADSLQETCEMLDSRISRVSLHLGHDVIGNGSAPREFALA